MEEVVDDVASAEAGNEETKSIDAGPWSDMGISKLSSRPDFPVTTGWTVRRLS